MKNKEINELNGDFYILVPIRKNNNEYIFMIGLITTDSKINLLFFIFNNEDIIINKNISLKYNNISSSNSNYNIEKTGLTCQLMYDSDNKDIIVCFIIIKPNDIKLATFLINPINYKIEKSMTNTYNITFKANEIKVIKSITTSDKKKSLVCFSYPGDGSECSIYSIESNNFSNKINYNVDCGDRSNKFNLRYMRETQQIFFFVKKIIESLWHY